MLHEPYLFYKNYTSIQTLLASFKDVSQFAFIAGGAPRDIYLDNPFSDIDIYLSGEANVFKVINTLGKIPGLTNLEVFTKENMLPQYRIPHLNFVINFTYCSLPFQVISTTFYSQSDILNHFAVNISKVSFEGRNIVLTEQAKIDIEQKLLTVNGDVPRESEYLKKIIRKFPRHKVVNAGYGELPF